MTQGETGGVKVKTIYAIMRKSLRSFLVCCAIAVIFGTLPWLKKDTIVVDHYLVHHYDHNYCIGLRGQEGIWVPAKGYSYAGEEAIEPHTEWTWEDSPTSCQIQQLSKDSFCKVVFELQLKRLFFVGDSLTFQMVNSLWQLLGNNDIFAPKGARGYVTRPILCDINLTEQFTINFQYVRNDHLTLKEGSCHPNYSKDACLPWVDRYQQNGDRTLVVANMGPHMRDLDVFKTKFDDFVEFAISEMNNTRPADLFMFRTTVPGHDGCSEESSPYHNESEFLKIPATSYQWNNFKDYNTYAKKKLSNISENINGERNRIPIILDVYPMTILRPDGHRLPSVDCLHYLLPGPPDWWNHLLFSHLLEMSSTT